MENVNNQVNDGIFGAEALLNGIMQVVGPAFVVMPQSAWIDVVKIIEAYEKENETSEISDAIKNLKIPVVPVTSNVPEEEKKIITPDSNIIIP